MNINPDTLIQTVQKGFRVSLGATASLLESMQDTQKRTDTFNQLNTNPIQLIEEWETKGEVTEREARNFVDSMLVQMSNVVGNSRSSADTPTTVNTSATSVNSGMSSVTSTDMQQDIQDLTAQISALRAELEKLRDADS